MAVLFVWRLSALGVLRHFVLSIIASDRGNSRVASSRQKDSQNDCPFCLADDFLRVVVDLDNVA